jgi:flavodoxin short chain
VIPKKILVTYGSLTGNTEVVASYLQEQLQAAGHDCALENGFEVMADSLKDYDLVIIGGSTWGDGELNPISEEFLANLDSSGIRLDGVKFSVFGLGESHYEFFCTGADTIDKKFQELGGERIGELHKIDGMPELEILDACWQWAQSLIESIPS